MAVTVAPAPAAASAERRPRPARRRVPHSACRRRRSSASSSTPAAAGAAHVAHQRHRGARGRNGLALGDLRAAARPARRAATPSRTTTSRVGGPRRPVYPQQFSEAPSGPGAVGAPVAWTAQTSCAKVAVLDTGAQYDHPDLKGNIWHNPHEVAVTTSTTTTTATSTTTTASTSSRAATPASTTKGTEPTSPGSSPAAATTRWASRACAGRARSAGQVHELARQGVVVLNRRRHRLRGPDGAQGRQRLLRIVVEVHRARGRGRLRPEQGRPARVPAGNDGTNNDAAPEYPAALTNTNIIAVAAVSATGRWPRSPTTTSQERRPRGARRQHPSTYLGSGYKVLSGTSMASPSSPRPPPCSAPATRSLSY